MVARGSKWVEGERWNMGDGGQEDHSVCYCNGGLVTTHLSKCTELHSKERIFNCINFTLILTIEGKVKVKAVRPLCDFIQLTSLCLLF